jgi:hypothetical protein
MDTEGGTACKRVGIHTNVLYWAGYASISYRVAPEGRFVLFPLGAQTFGLLSLTALPLPPTECVPCTVDKTCRKLCPSFAPSEISAVIFVLFSAPQIVAPDPRNDCPATSLMAKWVSHTTLLVIHAHRAA